MNPIREAAARLKGNWCHNGPNDEQGNRCGVNWLSTVCREFKIDTTSGGRWHHAFEIMAATAREQYPERLTHVGSSYLDVLTFAEFNDHRDTTEEEVLAVMEKAAIRYDELA